MDAVANRPMSLSPVFLAGLAAFSVALLGATYMGGLYLFGAMILFGVLVFASAAYPQGMLIFVVALAILVPVDLAAKIGPLPRIGPTRVLLAAFIIGLLMRRLAGGRPDVTYRDMPLKAWIALFLAAGVICTAFSVDPLKSVYTLISLCIEQFLVFYILYYFLKLPGFWNRLKIVLFITTVAVCLLAFYEELSRNSIMLLVYPLETQEFRGGILRVRSTFFHPIALGCYLNLVYPYVLADFMTKKRDASRLFLGTLIVLIAAALLLTVSRGPIIAFVFESCVLLVWWSRKDLIKKGMLAAGTVLFAAVVAFIMVNDNNAEKALRPLVNPSGISYGHISEGSSEYYRIALAKAVLSNLKGTRMIYGNGPGSFFVAGVQSRYDNLNHVLTAPDSSVFKLLFEYGALGTAVFSVLVLIILINSIKAIRNNIKTGSPFAYASTAAIAGFLWSNITVSMFTLLPLAMMYWMSVAMTIHMAKSSQVHYFFENENNYGDIT